MSHARNPLFRPRIFLTLVALVLFHCILDDRHAGTSTTTGNTISGVAMLSDGTIAAGAMVSLRTDSIVGTTPGGPPQCFLLAFTLADSQGRFKLDAPAAK